MAQSTGRKFWLVGTILSVGGSDYRGNTETDPGTGAPNTAATIQWGAGEGTSQNYVDPQTARGNPAAESPSTLYGFGWGLSRGQTNRDEAGAFCIIPAGDWTFSCHLHSSIVQTTNPTKLQVSCWKVAEDNSKTLLFTSSEGASANIALSASGGTTITCQALGVAEIVLVGPTPTVGETLVFEFFIRSVGAAVTGTTLTFYASHSDTFVLAADPGLRTRKLRSFSVVGVGVATAVKKIIPSVKLVAAVGVAAFAKKLTLARAFLITGIGVPAVQKKTTPNALQTTAVGVVSTSRTLTLMRGFSVVGIGVPTFSRQLIAARAFAVTAIGVVASSRSLMLARTFTVQAAGVVDFARQSVLARAFSVQAIGVAASDRVATHYRAFLVVGAGLVSVVKKTIKDAFMVMGVGETAFARQLTLARAFTVQAVGNADFARVVTSVRSFSVTAFGIVRGRVEMSFDVLNRITSGATTVIRRIINIFDD